MIRGPITQEDFRGQFSGHETFPLRSLWLRKAYDAVLPYAPKTLFADPSAIVTFGVGKNMALAIRYWAVACKIIEEADNRFRPSTLATCLFRPNIGWDPYLEQEATLWLLHWRIASTPEMTTTWYWAFNHVSAATFDHHALADTIFEYAQTRRWSRVAPKTVERDVDCFLRSYVAKQEAGPGEDHLEPVLAELGLIHPVAGRLFAFRRGPKPGLPDGVFAFALDEFWNRHAPNGKTLTVEAVTYEPGSPGQVFKLDEDSVIERLSAISEVTDRQMKWSDTAGIRQVARSHRIRDPLTLLGKSYPVTQLAEHAN